MASIKKSFRIAPELWERVTAAKAEGESDSATVSRLLEAALDHGDEATDMTAQGMDKALSVLSAQLEAKDKQITALTEQLKDTNAATLKTIATACEASARETQALAKALNRPKVVQAVLEDVDGKPIETKPKKSWFGSLFK